MLNLPLVTMILGQVSLAFFMILINFPKRSLLEIFRINSRYLFFLAVIYASLSLVPVSPKFITFGNVSKSFPELIKVNLLSIIFANLLSILFFAKAAKAKSKNLDTKKEKTQKTKLNIDRNTQEENSLLDLYIQEKKEKTEDLNLENLENIMLKKLTQEIIGAKCLNKEGKGNPDTVLKWMGYDCEKLISIFNKNNLSSQQLGLGALCQFLFNYDKSWYIVLKYRGNFILLQTDIPDPSILMETSYKIISELKAHNL